MKKVKNTVALLLLFIITVVAVAVPRATEYMRQKKWLSKKVEYRELSAVEHTEITARTVARLCLDNDFANRFLTPAKTPENAENEIKRLLNIIFADKEEVLKILDFSQTENEIYYGCNTVLTKNGNRPVALDFACYTLNNDTVSLQLVYEKKTDTVISVEITTKVAFNSAKKQDTFLKALDLSHYFGDILGLKNNEYYAEIDTKYLPNAITEVVMITEISRKYYNYSEIDG